MQKYRSLSKAEIDVLISNGCSSKDWQLISVKEGFEPHFIKNTQFSGR